MKWKVWKLLKIFPDFVTPQARTFYIVLFFYSLVLGFPVDVLLNNKSLNFTFIHIEIIAIITDHNLCKIFFKFWRQRHEHSLDFWPYTTINLHVRNSLILIYDTTWAQKCNFKKSFPEISSKFQYKGFKKSEILS